MGNTEVKLKAWQKTHKGASNREATWTPADDIEKEVAVIATREYLAVDVKKKTKQPLKHYCKFEPCKHEKAIPPNAFMAHFVKDHASSFQTMKINKINAKNHEKQKEVQDAAQAGKKQKQDLLEKKTHNKWSENNYTAAGEVAVECFRGPGPSSEEYHCEKHGCKNARLAFVKEKWLQHFKTCHNDTFKEILELVKNRRSVDELCDDYKMELKLENSVNNMQEDEAEEDENHGGNHKESEDEEGSEISDFVKFEKEPVTPQRKVASTMTLRIVI